MRRLFNESPDESIGPGGKVLRWDDKSSIAFGFMGNTCITHRYSNHPYMLSLVIKALGTTLGKMADVFKKVDVNIDKRPSEFDIQSTEKKLLETIKKGYNGEQRSRVVLAPCGRCWPQAKLVSFWDKRQNVPIAKIESVLNATGLKDKSNVRIEFIDDKPISYEKKWTYDDIVKGFEDVKSLSDEEVSKLTAKMHTVATSKPVKPGFGSMCDKIPWSKFCKSEAILMEDPDTVLGPDDEKVMWHHPQAIAFLFINGKCITGEAHDDMMDILSHEKNLKTIRNLGVHGDLTQEDLGAIAKAINKDPYLDVHSIPILQPSGRAWPHINTISFWSRRRKVKRSHINAICDKAGIPVHKARLEFLDYPDEFFGVDDLAKKLDNTTSLSDQEMQRRMAKQHVQSPIGKNTKVPPGIGSRNTKPRVTKFIWPHSESVFLEAYRPRKFWGKDAAGLIIKRPDGKILMLRRSGAVMGGGWGVPGGRIDHGDTAQSTVESEADQEMGGLPAGSFSGRKYVFRLPLVEGDYYIVDDEGSTVSVEQDGEEEFTYTTLEYLTTEEDWEPELNWEHDDFGWFTPQEAMKLKSVTQYDEKGQMVWPVRKMISSLYGGKNAI